MRIRETLTQDSTGRPTNPRIPLDASKGRDGNDPFSQTVERWNENRKALGVFNVQSDSAVEEAEHVKVKGLRPVSVELPHFKVGRVYWSI